MGDDDGDDGSSVAVIRDAIGMGSGFGATPAADATGCRSGMSGIVSVMLRLAFEPNIMSLPPSKSDVWRWREEPVSSPSNMLSHSDGAERRGEGSLNGLYDGLYCNLGARTSSTVPSAGMSGWPSVSNSMAVTSLNIPTASFTAAASICHIVDSFSNFISVFVGCMFTSMSSGFTVK